MIKLRKSYYRKILRRYGVKFIYTVESQKRVDRYYYVCRYDAQGRRCETIASVVKFKHAIKIAEFFVATHNIELYTQS